jgi:L-aminopeptidase/D-esterase-like protein
VALGLVGAGTGATLNKWQGPDGVRPGGLGSTAQRQGDLVVAALIAANPFGDIRDGRRRDWVDVKSPVPGLTNTTIGVVATNATLDKVGCLLVAQSAHDGLARALEPVHATMDGDALVVAAVGGVTAAVDQVRLLAARAVEDAVRMVGSA